MSVIKNPLAGAFGIKDSYGTNIGSYDVAYDNSLFNFIANISGAVIGAIYHTLVLPVSALALWVMGWVTNPQRLLSPMSKAYREFLSPILNLASFPLLATLAVGVLMVYLSFEKAAADNFRASAERVIIGVATAAVAVVLAADPFAPAAALYRAIGDISSEIVASAGAGTPEETTVATFLMPLTQMLNFGVPLDAAQSRAWSAALASGSFNDYVESANPVTPGFGYAAAGLLAIVTAGAMLWFAVVSAIRMALHLGHVIVRSVIIPWLLLYGVTQRRGFDTVTNNIGKLLAHTAMTAVILVVATLGPAVTTTLVGSITDSGTSTSAGRVIVSLVVTGAGFLGSAWLVERVSSNTGLLARALHLSSREKLTEHYSAGAPGSTSRVLAAGGGLLADNGDLYDPARDAAERIDKWLGEDKSVGVTDAETNAKEPDMIDNTPMFAGQDAASTIPADMLSPAMPVDTDAFISPAARAALDDYTAARDLPAEIDFTTPVGTNDSGTDIFATDADGHGIIGTDAAGRPIFGYSAAGDPVYGYNDDGSFVTGFDDNAEPYVETGQVFSRFDDVPDPHPRSRDVTRMPADELGNLILPGGDTDEHRLRLSQARASLADLVQVHNSGMDGAAVEGVAPEPVPEPVEPAEPRKRVEVDSFMDAAFGEGVRVSEDTGDAVDDSGEIVADREAVLNVFAVNNVALPDGFPLGDGQVYRLDQDDDVAEGGAVDASEVEVVTHSEVVERDKAEDETRRVQAEVERDQGTDDNTTRQADADDTTRQADADDTTQRAAAGNDTTQRSADNDTSAQSSSAQPGVRLASDRRIIEGAGASSPEAVQAAQEVYDTAVKADAEPVSVTPTAASPLSATYVDARDSMHAASRVVSAACGFPDVTPVSFDDPAVAVDFDVVGGQNVVVNPHDIGFDT